MLVCKSSLVCSFCYAYHSKSSLTKFLNAIVFENYLPSIMPSFPVTYQVSAVSVPFQNQHMLSLFMLVPSSEASGLVKQRLIRKFAQTTTVSVLHLPFVFRFLTRLRLERRDGTSAMELVGVFSKINEIWCYDTYFLYSCVLGNVLPSFYCLFTDGKQG